MDSPDRAASSLAVIRWGIAAGLGTCLVYPLLIAVPLPDAAAVTLAAAMGPLLGLSAVGLAELLRLGGARWTAWTGAGANALAGALLTAMLLVQLAAGLGAPTSRAALATVWLGLDVAWDVYVALGTLLFGVAMLRHPRFGPLWGGGGIVAATALLALNLATFPLPPGEAGLVDLGPAVALWYLLVTMRCFASLGWAREQLA